MKALARSNRLVFPLLIVTFLSTSCFNERLPEYRPDTSLETERVYRAAIKHWFHEYDSTRQLAILNPPNSDGISKWVDKFDSLDEVAVATFRNSSEGPTQLTSGMFDELPFAVRVFEMDALIGEKGEILDKKMRSEGSYSGLLRLSVLLFNSDRTLAIVQGEYTHCPLCSFEEVLLLKRQEPGGEWKVVDQIGLWIS